MLSVRRVLCQIVNVHRSLSVGCYINYSKVLWDRKHLERFFGSRTMATGGDNAHSCASNNRLGLERSPYLLQHAANPVDWYPWGEEAFEKAREENKLIFLSVGYSTCHWCHVMERESFENPDIASIMNAHFVSIKVDREERPDIDKMYMTFIQASTGGGGWPMSVWLTPQLSPVFGGTYYPPSDKEGRPGFKSMLINLNKQWEENPVFFLESGAQVIEVLQGASALAPASTADVPSQSCVNACLAQFSSSYETEYGGFSRAPKFPQASVLNFMLHYHARNPATDKGKMALEMCTHTMTCMARGGIHDHVAQGVHRYSTDKRWHVPHFEKMLYDQGQLAVAYSNAYAATKNDLFADMVEDILSYVERELSDKAGGFYSAEDADSLPSAASTEKKEGAFCVWTHRQIFDLLSPLSEKHFDVFAFHYNIKPEGNVSSLQDRHGEFTGQNVLYVSDIDETTAEAFGLDVEPLQQMLVECRQVLFDARQLRPKPHLDSKMITSWNGLMISGFARGAQVLRSSELEDRAVIAANFVKRHLYDESTGMLLRSCYRGDDGEVAQISVPITGFVDDYAFMIRALLDLYETCFDCSWLDWAEHLQDMQDVLFWDEQSAGYFTCPSTDPSIVVRLKEGQDTAEPSGNSVSASNLLRLSAHLDRSDLYEKAGLLLSAFAERLNKTAMALPEMNSALMVYNNSVTHVYVTGERTAPDTAALLDVIYSRMVPGCVLALTSPRRDAEAGAKCQPGLGMKPLNGKAAAYVCRQQTCSLPVNTPEALAELMDQQDF